MAKITIEELYRGEKYDIMSAVTAKALQLGIDERTEEYIKACSQLVHHECYEQPPQHCTSKY